MAHTLAYPTGWYNLQIIPGSLLSTLDGYLAACCNGDGGGGYGPSIAITIGGAGVYVLGPWGIGGAGAIAQSSPALPFTLGDSDFFVLGAGHSGASRTIYTQAAAGLPVQLATGFQSELGLRWLATTIGTMRTNLGSQTEIPAPLALAIPLRVHNGATITSVQLTWAVGRTHSAVPENLPKWRVVKTNASTGQATPLNSTFSGSYDPAGYLLMTTPASGSTYYNSGTQYTPTYTCDADEVIDTSTFDYSLQWVDEWGPSNAENGNLIYGAACSFTVATMEFQT